MNVPKNDLNIFLNNPATEVLQELIASESFHKMFWPDLCQREDFQLRRRTDYGVDELFVDHSILGINFPSDGDSEEPSNLGGVIDLYATEGGTGVTSKSDFYFRTLGSGILEPSWYQLEEYLGFYEYVNAFTAQGEESLVDIAEFVFLQHHGLDEEMLVAAFLTLALTFSSDVDDDEKVPANLSPTNNFSDKYGFEFQTEIEDYLFQIYTSHGSFNICDFYTSVSLNSDYQNVFTWGSLTDEVRNQVYNWLQFGAQSNDEWLSRSSIHFLCCMALHEKTTDEMLKKLEEMNIELLKEVIKYRNS